MEVELAKAMVGWALEKGKMELDVVKAKVELIKAKKEALEAVERYKASKDFMA